MSRVSGVPTTRITDLFVRQRLLQQIQSDQRDLFDLQTQLSTGHRFAVPSADPVSALRVIGLQRLLEQKSQVRTNLSATQSYLSATDSALSGISDILSDVRATALGVLGTTASDDQRAAAALQIQQAIQQLLDAGNQKFRGRYLFAGSSTETRPFVRTGNNLVLYDGNETQLRSYVDTDLLAESNIAGSDLFGAISAQIVGTADLQPRLRFDTPLSDLNNGAGIAMGSVAISDGSRTEIVDLSSAHTIGDVALMMRKNSAGIPLNVQVTSQGLRIQLDSATGDLSIRDVGNGTVARQLGIFREIGVGTATIEGAPLRPKLTPSTLLSDILGAPARAALGFPGADNDFFIEAVANGQSLNGVKIRLVDDPAVAAGSESVEFDAALQEMTIRIDEAHTQARDVVAAVNSAYASGQIPFFAYLDQTDQGANPGQGLVFPTATGSWVATTAGGTGEDFDRESGLQITNAGQTFAIDLSDAVTIEDLLNRLNDPQYGLLAQVSDNGRGITLRSRVSGADFAVGENGGKTATQLGLRTLTEQTRLDQLNFGQGVNNYQDEGQTAQAVFDSVGLNNGLMLQSRSAGPQFNGYRLRVYDTGGAPGSEVITYDEANQEIAIGIVPGSTTAKQIVDLFAATPGARDDFSLRLGDEGSGNDGSGLLQVGEATTSGGTSGGVDFVITRADGVAMGIDITGAVTISDVIDRINNHPDNPPRAPGQSPWLVARLASYGNGIELVDESVGSGVLTVQRNPLSTAAMDLGLIPAGQEKAAAMDLGSLGQAAVASPGANNDLVFQTKFPTTQGNGYQIVFEDSLGEPEKFDFDPVNKVLRFRIQPGVTTAQRITELFAADPLAGELFEVHLDPSDGNDGSGLVAPTDTANSPKISGGESQTLIGRDVRPLETEGIFTALIRLQNALTNNDVPEAQRAIDMLDQGVLNLNFKRAELGARQQGLEILGQRLDDENLQLQNAMSNDYDADLAEVISNLMAKQSAFQASLQATALIFNMTLLDYL